MSSATLLVLNAQWSLVRMLHFFYCAENVACEFVSRVTEQYSSWSSWSSWFPGSPGRLQVGSAPDHYKQHYYHNTHARYNRIPQLCEIIITYDK